MSIRPNRQTRPLVVPVFLPHAGCPHRCLFCNQQAVTGGSDARPDPSRIRAHIKAFLSASRRRPMVEIAFFGGTFLGLPKTAVDRMLALAAEFVAAGRADGIRFSTRPDTVDPWRIDWIRRYPVTTVELGVQSLDDRVLSECRRGHTSADAAAAIGHLRRAGFRIGMQLMIGLPGQGRASVLETASLAADLAPDFVRIYPTLVLEGSPLAERYRKGRFIPLSLGDAVEQAAAAYRLFAERGVPVVRMGLQPTADLESGGRILAGPYHPAFGEQVRSAALHETLAQALGRIRLRGKSVCITVHPTRESQLRGPGSDHLGRLAERFSLTGAVAAKDAGLDPDAIRIEADGQIRQVRIF
jgi:histone acetyltransferase (RNA polymerase elongator complex component)